MATVGEARMRLFPNYFFENKTRQTPWRGGGRDPATTLIDQLDSETGLTRQYLESEQTEMEQTYQIVT